MQSYIEPLQTKLFNELGVIFAYSQQQFNEARVGGVEYSTLGMGLIVPTDNVEMFHTGHKKVVEEAVKLCLAENTIKDLIYNSLANYECQITMCIDDAVEALEVLGITREQVRAGWAEYYQYCVDNDYF